MPAAKGFNMIYYVEDDDNIRDLTVYALRKQGIEAEGFSCDGEFKAAVARRVPDAVLLDIMLPDTDGLAIMRRLRADRLTATVPIMMLTAKDTELDKVMALDGGADDYLTKPFSLMELASRCRALLRRGGMVKQASDVLSVGDIVLSPSHREVTVAGEPLKLTLREFDLLEYLMRKPGVVLPASRCCRACGAGTSTAVRAPLTCTCRRFAKTGRACRRHRDRARRGLPLGRAFCR